MLLSYKKGDLGMTGMTEKNKTITKAEIFELEESLKRRGII